MLYSCSTAQAQLSGSYTIDPAGSGSRNFTSFTMAVDTLNAKGISAPVIFKAADGSYREQIRIKHIKGSSADNTVTFEGNSGDSTKVRLYVISATGNYVIWLDSADHIIFTHLKLERISTFTTSNHIIYMSGGSDSDRFVNNLIKGTYTTNDLDDAAILYCSGINTADSFSHNVFKGGGRGLVFTEPSTQVKGTVIENNVIDSIYNYSIYLTRYAATIRNNTLTNLINSYCIYLNRANGSSLINGNYIKLYLGGIGIEFDHCSSGSNSVRSTVSNNMISISAANAAAGPDGIIISNSGYIDIYFNSVNIYNAINSSYSSVLYLNTGAHLNIYNNIFANKTGGTVISYSATSPPASTKIDYNDLYFSGTTSGKTSATNLANWQLNHYDSNSVPVDPGFKSNTDLHIPRNDVLIGIAKPEANVTADYDGEPRDSIAPDIGADEMHKVNVDAYAVEMIPDWGQCRGMAAMTVRIKNCGNKPLDSVRVALLADSVKQTEKFYRLNGLYKGSDTVLRLGSVWIGDTTRYISVYLSASNDTTDIRKDNDSLDAYYLAKLTGSYSIGSTGMYKSFTAAVNDLIKRGICGPVTFNVEDGSYNEQVSIPGIAGASASSRVTFRSKSGDNSKVKLYYTSSTAANNYVLQLYGANYFTFKDISFQAGAGTYASVIKLANCHNDSFSGNLLKGYYVNSTGVSSDLFYLENVDTLNVFINNRLSQCVNGIVSKGYAYPLKGRENIIENNSVDSFTGMGIDLDHATDIWVSRNTIAGSDAFNTGVQVDNCFGDVRIDRNDIQLSKSGKGINITYSDGGGNGISIYNNMISIGGDTTAYGIADLFSDYIDITYNSINITSTSKTDGRAFYYTAGTTSGVGSNLRYNILSNPGGGYAAYVLYGINIMDYNDLYSSGTYLGRYKTTDAQNLADWRTASGHDKNSFSVDPEFEGAMDLHTRVLALNGKAKPLPGITTDYDGQLRDTLRPDIGADEFIPRRKNMYVRHIIGIPYITCGDSNTTTGVVLYNGGTDTLNGFTVHVTMSGTDTQSLNAVDTIALAPDETDTFYLPKGFNTYKGGAWIVKAYCKISGDSVATNDTAWAAVKTNPVPAPPQLKGTNVCGHGTVKLTATTSEPGANIHWYRNIKDAVPAYTGATYSLVLDSSATFYAEVESSKGCLSPRASVSVQVYKAYRKAALLKALPFDGTFNTGTAISPDEVCSGHTIGYAIHPPGNAKPIDFGKTWSLTYLKLATIQGIVCKDTFQVLPDSSHDFQVHIKPSARFEDSTLILTATVKDLVSGCDTTLTRYIHVNAVPHVNFTYHSACPNANVVFTDSSWITSGQSLNYWWDFGDGNSSTLKNPSHSYKSAGSYQVKLKLSAPNTCTDSVVKKIIVFPAPKAAFTAHNICIGESLALQDSSVIDTGSIATYSWKFGDGNYASGSTASHSYAAAGSYRVTLTIRSDKGCEDSVSHTVQVYALPSAQFTLSDSELCQSGSLILSPSSQGSGSTYIWDFGDSTNDTTTAAVSHTYHQAGNFAVRLLEINANGCTNSSSRNIEVNPAPVFDMSASSLCQGDKTVFRAAFTSDTADVLSYQWFFGDGDSSSEPMPSHVYSKAGKYLPSLTVMTKKGCTATVTRKLQIVELPDAHFSYTTDHRLVHLSVNQPDTGTTYHWNFGDGELSDSGSSVQHTYKADSTYTVSLRATNYAGCTEEYADTIVVKSDGIPALVNSHDIRFSVYPNPFEDAFRLVYSIPAAAMVNISMYDIYGRPQLTLYEGKQRAGEHLVLCNAQEHNIKPGVYIVHLLVNDQDMVTRLVKLR